MAGSPNQLDVVKAKGVAQIVASILDEYVPPDTPTGDTLGAIAKEQAAQFRSLHDIPEPEQRNRLRPVADAWASEG